MMERDEEKAKQADTMMVETGRLAVDLAKILEELCARADSGDPFARTAVQLASEGIRDFESKQATKE